MITAKSFCIRAAATILVVETIFQGSGINAGEHLQLSANLTPEILKISISGEGKVSVPSDGEIFVEETELGLSDLKLWLLAFGSPHNPISVQCDRETPYGATIVVLGALRRAGLDEVIFTSGEWPEGVRFDLFEPNSPSQQSDRPIVVSRTRDGSIFLQERRAELSDLAANLLALTAGKLDTPILMRIGRNALCTDVIELLGAVEGVGFSRVAVAVASRASDNAGTSRLQASKQDKPVQVPPDEDEDFDAFLARIGDIKPHLGKGEAQQQKERLEEQRRQLERLHANRRWLEGPREDIEATTARIVQNIADCWRLPPGLTGDDGTSFQLRINLRINGQVEDVSIEDTARLAHDPAFRVVAESARRAIDICGPLPQLPPDEFDAWREMILTFDTEAAIGG